MADWVGAVADLLAPLGDQLAERVKAAVVVRTDATGLRVLEPASPAHIEMGTMWCTSAMTTTWSSSMRREAMGNAGRGRSWRDAAGMCRPMRRACSIGYTPARVASAVEVGCWAHGRRRLVEQDTDARVAYPLQLIARLHRIEHLADAEQRTPDARRDLRQERSQRVVDKLERLLVPTLAAEPPSSAFAKALAYFVNRWTALTRFLADGRLALDNNLCEQRKRSDMTW
jgi:hypothetical protein